MGIECYHHCAFPPPPILISNNERLDYCTTCIQCSRGKKPFFPKMDCGPEKPHWNGFNVVLFQVYSKFAWSNPLHVDIFPDGKNLHLFLSIGYDSIMITF